MIKEIYSQFASIMCRKQIHHNKNTIYLMFHSIENNDSNLNSIYHMPVSKFQKICALLRSISDDALRDHGVQIEFICTFDDGYQNYIDNALPILEKYNLKSIVFLIAKNLIIQSKGYIEEAGLKKLMSCKNVSIGMHGYSHVDLSSLSTEQLSEELLNIKNVCETFSFSTKYFSLPFGRANDGILSKLGDQGFTEIFTSDYGTKVSKKTGYKIYPRIDIWSDDTNTIVKQKIKQCWKVFYAFESRRANLYKITN